MNDIKLLTLINFSLTAMSCSVSALAPSRIRVKKLNEQTRLLGISDGCWAPLSSHELIFCCADADLLSNQVLCCWYAAEDLNQNFTQLFICIVKSVSTETADMKFNSL